jgi:hypothetical protein
MTSSIFEEYYSSRPFEDRFARDQIDRVAQTVLKFGK